MPDDFSSDRLLLLLPTTTYRADPFLEAARRLNLEVVVGSDFCHVLADNGAYRFRCDSGTCRRRWRISSRTPESIPSTPSYPSMTIPPRSLPGLARFWALPHNTTEAAIAARNKYRMREMLSGAGEWCPYFTRFDVTSPIEEIALEQPYPCVLKPVLLSGSRGVIRADTPDEFVAAVRRIGRILDRATDRPPGLDPDSRRIMVESYIPGTEVALEGLLTRGRLRVLALFDKPDPLEGPFFEETIYVTPSRLSNEMQHVVVEAVRRASAAVGLSEGPVHAELRVRDGEARMIEIAGRSIGGLCSRVLEFGLGVSLEELILRHALGQDVDGIESDTKAAGVMMLPVPEGGLFQGCTGVAEAKKTPGVEDVVITAKKGDILTPLPEGASYPGFIFARGDGPGKVEQSLRTAHSQLRMRVQEVLPS